MEIIKIGSRESKLAMIQTNLVADYIKAHYPDIQVEIVPMTTKGDQILDKTLDKIGGKGLFVKELDQALLDGRTMLSVHSLKDLPMEGAENLPILGYSKREDPRDVLVLPEGVRKMDKEKPVGCSSQRRILQFQKLYPDASIKSVRGNVLTRLKKLDSGEYGALILAAAGLKRLGLENRISRYFEPEEMIPAAGQGILCVQGRNEESAKFLKGYFDSEAKACALSERAFVRTLDGGCSSPIAAYAVVKEENLFLTGLYYKEDTKETIIGNLRGKTKDAEKIGCTLALDLRGRL